MDVAAGGQVSSYTHTHTFTVTGECIDNTFLSLLCRDDTRSLEGDTELETGDWRLGRGNEHQVRVL